MKYGVSASVQSHLQHGRLTSHRESAEISVTRDVPDALHLER